MGAGLGAAGPEPARPGSKHPSFTAKRGRRPIGSEGGKSQSIPRAQLDPHTSQADGLAAAPTPPGEPTQN